jgi:glycine/D-amino acid oxidase-like deaminating enzyme
VFDLFTPESRKQHHAPIPRAAIVERRRGRSRAAGWLYGWLYKPHRKLYLVGALSIRAKYLRVGVGASAGAGMGAGVGAGVSVEAIYRR